MVTPPDETTADPYAVIATLRAERDAALAREAALDEVLDLINRSPAEAQPVFDKILEKAHSLCDAAMGALLLYSNELIWAVATRGYSGAAGALARQPRPLAPEQQGLALGQRVVQITGEQSLHDVNSSFGRAFVELTGARTYLMVPLRKDGELLGAISVVRQEVRPFSEQDIALLERFAEQAVIAMENTRLVTELRQRTDELARRNSEYGERVDHQAAMIEVLKVMSASPGETQPVFDLIVRQAQSQCNSASAALYEFDGMIHCRSFASSVLSSDAIEAYFRQFPMPLQQTSNHSLTVSIRDRRIVHIRDASAAEEVSTVSRDQGVESAIVVPLITPDGAAGCIALSELRPGGYSDAQIALLQTFAEQAVIAITSAETYRALQTRTTDLQETLEYQTAISDVLKVIGGSTFDLQPVFDTIVTTAAQLCEAGYANITIRENDGFRVVAGYSNLPDRPFWGIGRSFPVDRNSITGRTVLAQQFVHLIDVTLDPEFALLESARRSGMRSILGVPLMRDGIVVGTLNLGRVQVRPFTGRQIDLIRTFADQAVIAIENTRLLTEQREALDQQTATADVLQVINSSPGNLVPVFDAMLEKAMRLCGAAYGVLRSFDSEHLDTLASRGVPSEYAAFLAWNADLNKLGANASTTSLTQALRTCQPTQILDVREGIAYKGGSPGSVAIADIGGARTILHVPLVKDLTSVGLFTIYRQEVRAFSDKQVALLENFAAQAVVAMENARLLTEQREALEQQTATAEVLQVINASPGDLAPVFDAMLEKALRLCEAAFGIINTYDGELFHPVAMRSPPALEDTFRSAPNLPRASRHSGLRRIVLGEDVVQIEDLAADPAYQEGEARRVIEAAGAHSYLGVALRLEGKLLGTIGTYRQEVRPFSDKQIALLQNFAAQAVIAMENARLLGELRQRTNDLQSHSNIRPRRATC